MRDSILRRFIGCFSSRKDQNRKGSRWRSTHRRLAFESCEARQMFSAADIFSENMLTGAVDWQVRSPDQDLYDQNDQLIAERERPRAPYGIAWNGFTDSTQQRGR
jgi:hypothetical protein